MPGHEQLLVSGLPTYCCPLLPAPSPACRINCSHQPPSLALSPPLCSDGAAQCAQPRLLTVTCLYLLHPTAPLPYTRHKTQSTTATIPLSLSLFAVTVWRNASLRGSSHSPLASLHCELRSTLEPSTSPYTSATLATLAACYSVAYCVPLQLRTHLSRPFFCLPTRAGDSTKWIKAGSPALEKAVAHPNLRWHFYVAPKDWQAAPTENLSRVDEFTTAPLENLALGFNSDHLRLKFKDPSAQASMAQHICNQPIGSCDCI